MRLALWSGKGVAHLAMHSAAEITDLVTEMHGTIKRVPLPIGASVVDARLSAPFPYRLIAKLFRQLARGIGMLPVHADLTHQPPYALAIISALNGVCGDKLARWQSPLALPMSLRDSEGQAMAWGDLAGSNGNAKVVLYLHGLCMSERDWQTPAKLGLDDLMQNKGWQIGHLRYNSGRAIWQNGEDLANWLEAANAAYPAREIVLIGHSMGGLLMRSAFVYAQAHGQRWPARVSKAAYLATPHLGAPLERAGNRANTLLGHSPYTAPFMRLGNIRSAAIKDLRYGFISQEEHERTEDMGSRDHRLQLAPLPDGMAHLVVAGSMNPDTAKSWVGDGLVPLYSGLGQHKRPEKTLVAADITRLCFDHVDHMAMLSDVRVWDALTDWWLAR
ncbi:MAG: alpha/beta fold hydrolase [Paraperlucidibaca sp.]